MVATPPSAISTGEMIGAGRGQRKLTPTEKVGVGDAVDGVDQQRKVVCADISANSLPTRSLPSRSVPDAAHSLSWRSATPCSSRCTAAKLKMSS